MKSRITVEDCDLSTTSPSSSEPTSETTWVYLWKMTQKGPGHAAIQVGGRAPKTHEHQPGEYWSLRPEGMPSAGPTTMLPLAPEFVTNLTDDMAAETPKIKETGDILSDPLTIQSEISKAPDHIFKIDGLNTKAMKEKITQTKNNNTRYQLFPNINLLHILNDAISYKNLDPFGTPHPENDDYTQQDKRKYAAENCATSVSNILTIGGKSIQKSRFLPWGLTPNDLINQLSENNEPIQQSYKR